MINFLKALVVIVVVVGLCGCEETTPPKTDVVTNVYKIYRENNDGSYTRWVTTEKPEAKGMFLIVKSRNNKDIMISGNITVIEEDIKTLVKGEASNNE